MRAHPHARDGGYEREQDMLRRCGREHDPRAEHERELEQALLVRRDNESPAVGARDF
jgi:hypothetical protein